MSSTPKKKRKIRNELSKEETPTAKKVKNFQTKWLTEKEFKGWLKQVPSDNTKCECTPCKAVILAGRSELLKHASSQKHEQNVRSIQNTPAVTSYVKPDPKMPIIEAELKLSSYIAKTNVALSASDTLIPLLKKLFTDSNICQEITLGRKKCTYIIRNVLSPVITEDIIVEIGDKPFSILVDESTDVTDTKFMALLVRYVDNNLVVREHLLEMIPLHVISCTAKNLFELFKNCCVKHNLKIENIVGMACDNANVMVGAENSFFTHLKAVSENVVLLRCMCHSAALISSHACGELPRSPEELVRQIGTYTSGSAKRCETMKEIQKLFDGNVEKMLKLSNTRWLSFLNCIERILENYDILQTFFTNAMREDKLKTAESILAGLKNNCNKAYLLFLKYALKSFTTFNLLFQSKKILIGSLSEESRNLLRTICGNYMKADYICNIEKLSVTEPNYFKNLNEVYVGPECGTFLENLPAEISTEIRKSCLKFYIEAAVQIKTRLPINDGCFDELRFIEPKKLFEQSKSGSVMIPHLRSRYQNSKWFNANEAEVQLNNMLTTFKADEIRELSEYSIEDFWRKMKAKKNFNDEFIFRDITTLVEIILCYPHSNAETERVFSVMKDIKTPKRNRLSDRTLNAIMVFRCATRDTSALDIIISKKHTQRLNCKMYEKKMKKKTNKYDNDSDDYATDND